MPRFWDWLRNRAPKKEKKKKRKKRRKDTPKDDIHGLHTQLETLRKRKEHLMNRMEEQDAIARRNVKTNKDAAKAALRRKKAHEHSIDQTTCSK
ncbi:hypothetical protein CIB48_g10460 [Xylaria polymorpha]|nr:hypothetical protein CIB48_g10460 [Xylaria polymorpha]